MFRRNESSGPSAVLVLLAFTAALLSENCVSLIGKKTQSVDFTSRPYGANVYIDGKLVGKAPLRWRLRKRSPHTIRIEQEGFRPVEIKLKSRISWGPVLIANLVWSMPCALLALSYGFDAQDETKESISNMFAAGIFLAPIAAITIDAVSSDSRRFTSQLNVALEKDDGNAQPALLEMDTAEFRKVVWIRALCEADGPEKK